MLFTNKYSILLYLHLSYTKIVFCIDDNVYLRESIVDVKYSPTSQESDFREIREIAESY